MRTAMMWNRSLYLQFLLDNLTNGLCGTSVANQRGGHSSVQFLFSSCC